MKSFLIKGAYHNKTKCFPSLNDLLSQAEKSPYKYNATKKKFEMVAINAIRLGLKGWKATGKIKLHYTFCEPKDGHYRDYDNIQAAAHKIINDALIRTKTIHDDAPKYLAPSEDTFIYGDKSYIKVEIEELED